MSDNNAPTYDQATVSPPQCSDELLRQVSEQLAEIQARLAKINCWQESLEGLVGIAFDVADEQAAKLSTSGSSPTPADQQLAGVMTLVEHLTRKETAEALTALVDRAPQLRQLLIFTETAPDLLAMAVDTLDDWARRVNEDGVDLVQVARRGLRVAMWLGERISERELDRLGTLLRSDLLDPHALEVVAQAATALARTQEAVGAQPTPLRAGLVAGLRALREPGTQKSLAFAIQFSQVFGGLVGQPGESSLAHKESP
jgi:hypothetical protein